MRASDPVKALALIAADAVQFAEQIDRTNPSIESGRLITAARVFGNVMDLYVEYLKQEEANDAARARRACPFCKPQ